MKTVEGIVEAHYGKGGLLHKLESALGQDGVSLESLGPEDLVKYEHLHSGGRATTEALAEFAELSEGNKVLDLGCGIGGSSRFLAGSFKCQVVGLDLTKEFVDVARDLTARLKLEDSIEYVQGSALSLPFEDLSFDYVWTEHVQMNIGDKNKLYSEIMRVLRPGGCLVLHDILAEENDGGGGLSFPVPWAESIDSSFLMSEKDLKAELIKLGFLIEKWQDKTVEAIEFFREVSEKFRLSEKSGSGASIIMGENCAQKIGNLLLGLDEGKAQTVFCLARKK